MIISTGMATLGEVEAAVDTIRGAGNEKIIILQCTTNYPSLVQDSNIRAMITMQNALEVLTGYSDHTENNYSIFAAVALGACVIEKHFTLDKNSRGPDHSCSLNQEEFTQMVYGVREIEKSLGRPVKTPTENEKKNMLGMRRSIVTKRQIPAGAYITRDSLEFKRPATGLEPRLLYHVVGKIARRDIQADTPLSMGDINW